MRKLALAPLAAAAALYAPFPLNAQEGGGATALVPVSEVPTGSVDGAAEAPAAEAEPAPAPAAPAPAAPEEAPQLVPPEEMAPAPEPEPAAAPGPEPKAAAALVEVSQLPDDGPVGKEPSTPPVDPTPDREETDPEEFEEEFDDPEPEPPAEGEDLPSAPTAVPVAARLPETGSDVAPLAGIGMSLLLIGGSLRRVRPARR